MKSEKEIRERIAELIRMEESAKRSGEDPVNIINQRDALVWVLDTDD